MNTGFDDAPYEIRIMMVQLCLHIAQNIGDEVTPSNLQTLVERELDIVVAQYNEEHPTNQLRFTASMRQSLAGSVVEALSTTLGFGNQSRPN